MALFPAFQKEAPQAPGTKLGVLVTAVNELFAFMGGDGDGNAIAATMTPLLKQGLAIMARRADELPADQRQQMEVMLAGLLRKLANGLDDAAMSADEYAAGFVA